MRIASGSANGLKLMLPALLSFAVAVGCSSGAGPADHGSSNPAEAGAGGQASSDSSGGASGEGEPAPDSESGAGGVASGTPGRGRVVDFDTGRPLPGRRVVVGSSLTKRSPVVETDLDGTFEFEATGSYRALVIEPDGSSITYFEGLTGSDPVLTHHPSSEADGDRAVATITGSLSGGATYPLTGANDMVVVHLLSRDVSTRAYIGVPATDPGPGFALYPAFTSPRLESTLLALGIFRDSADDNAYTAAAVVKQLKLVGGKSYTQDLTLEPIPLGHVRGKVNVPAGWNFVQTSEYYRLPIPDAKIGFPYAPQTRVNPLTNDGAFDYELPDLRQLGGQLCIVGIASEAPPADENAPDSDGTLLSEVCDLPLDGPDIDIDFEQAPALNAPLPNETFGVGSRFSWSRPGSASKPNLVQLEPGLVSAETPFISIFTTSATATLPDLTVWGVQLPAAAAYDARPIALASEASNAFASDGLGSLTPQSRRASSASRVPLIVGP